MKKALLAGSLASFFAATPALAADDPLDALPTSTSTPTSTPTSTSTPTPTSVEPDRGRERPGSAAPKNALSLDLFSLLNSGVAIEYERFLAPPRFSLAMALGVRHGGGADYDVFEGTGGAEARWWLAGISPFSRFASRAMVGPYLGIGASYGVTRESRASRLIGSSMHVEEAVSLGARIAFAQRFEITPSVGMGLRTEIDPSGALAPWTRFEIVRFGLTAGVLF